MVERGSVSLGTCQSVIYRLIPGEDVFCISVIIVIMSVARLIPENASKLSKPPHLHCSRVVFKP